MPLRHTKQISFRRLGIHTGVFIVIYFGVFMTLLWAGARTFPSQGPIHASDGLDFYVDHLALMTVDIFFWPFHYLGYEFLKMLGKSLWFVVAAFWSILFYLTGLTICLLNRRKPNHAIELSDLKTSDHD